MNDDIVWDDQDIDWESAEKRKPGFMTGLGLSTSKSLSGAGRVLPKAVEGFLTRQDVLKSPQDLAAIQAEVDQGGTMGKLGQLTGDIGQLAVGGTKLIPSTVVAGVHGALQNPDSPVKSGLQAAAGNVAGQGAFKVLKEAGTRVGSHLFKATPDAKVLMDQGVVPTLGRGSDPTTFMGANARRAEDLAETTKLTRGPLRGQIAQGDEALMEAALKRTGRTVPPASMPLKDRVFQVGQGIRNDYETIFKGATHTLDPDLTKKLLGTLKTNNLDPATAKDLQKFYTRFYVERVKDKTVPLRVLDDFRGELRERLALANPTEKAALSAAIKHVDDKLTTQLGKMGRDLKGLDRQFAEFKPIERAMKSNVRGTPMTPEAYERGVRQNARAIGKSELDPTVPGAELSGPASRTLTRGPYSEASTWDALFGAVASPALRLGEAVTHGPKTRAWLMGDQKVKQEMIKRLRRGGTPDWVMGIIGNKQMTDEE